MCGLSPGDMSRMIGQGRVRLGGERARWRGALAGVIPTAAIGMLFAVSGSAAAPFDLLWSLLLVSAIAMTAGWIAGPAVGQRPRGWLIGGLAYAIAFVGASVALSVVQAAWDVTAGAGLDPLALMVAVTGRALIGLAGAAYLIVPAIVLGLAWSAGALGLRRLDAWHSGHS